MIAPMLSHFEPPFAMRHIKMVLGLTENQVNRYVKTGWIDHKKVHVKRPYREFTRESFVVMYLMNLFSKSGFTPSSIDLIFQNITKRFEKTEGLNGVGEIIIDRYKKGYEIMVVREFHTNSNVYTYIDFWNSNQFRLTDYIYTLGVEHLLIVNLHHIWGNIFGKDRIYVAAGSDEQEEV